MKTVTYKHEEISSIMSALNQIRTAGIDQAKLIVYIAGVLDGGEIKTRHEPPGKEDEKSEAD